MALAQRYRHLATLPRRPDKAKVHFIPSGLFGIFGYEEWEFLNEGDYDEVLSYLRQQDPDIIRGDIIVIEEHINEDERADMGKMAFDGENIINWNLDGEMPDIRFLPTEFQVVSEFPLQYWSEVFDDPTEMLVPFDFKKQMPDFRSENIASFDVQEEPDGGFTLVAPTDRPGRTERMLVIPFRDSNGTVYNILGHAYGIGGPFENEVKVLKYFGVLNPLTREHSHYHKIPYDPDLILLIPDVTTPAN